jgi:hypothetical protein
MRPLTKLALPCVLFAASCMMTGPSRVGQGQLYITGRSQYDTYFRDVHTAQVEAASWADDKRGTHKALVAALDLTPDAPDVTIVQATHERASKYAPRAGALRLEITGTDAHVAGATADASTFFKAIEDTAHAELERAKRMHAVEPKLEALAKTGHDLEPHVAEDFDRRGSQKVQEVRMELSASYDALDKLDAHAKRESREAEDFVADLERALETASEERAKNHGAKPAAPTPSATSTPATPPSRPRRDETPRPAPRPAGESAAPKPAPTPKPADTGEVFTP